MNVNYKRRSYDKTQSEQHQAMSSKQLHKFHKPESAIATDQPPQQKMFPGSALHNGRCFMATSEFRLLKFLLALATICHLKSNNARISLRNTQ